MESSLFTVELPIIKTNEEPEEVKKKYPEYDAYFIASGCCEKRREKFEKLWEKSNISHLSLTSVGIAIATSYFEQIVGEKIDIDIWIN